MAELKPAKKRKTVTYDRWGYFFIAPFFIVFVVFSLIPLLETVAISFFKNYRIGLTVIGPTFIGFENFKQVFSDDILRYAKNTLVMWLLGFIPQIVFSLLLSVLFTNAEMRLKFKQFFKTVIYMPGLIMASAFAMLFFTLFSPEGPVNSIFKSLGIIEQSVRFFDATGSVHALVAVMNCLLWYGNTTILLMAGIMGIDESLYEAARIDGASPSQTFFKITLPLLLPILVFVVITSLIGGIQMFDIPQILTNGEGVPDRTSMTIIMYLNKHLANRNYGMAGAVSVLTFAVTVVLSFSVYAIAMKQFRALKGITK